MTVTNQYKGQEGIKEGKEATLVIHANDKRGNPVLGLGGQVKLVVKDTVNGQTYTLPLKVTVTFYPLLRFLG